MLERTFASNIEYPRSHENLTPQTPTQATYTPFGHSPRANVVASNCCSSTRSSTWASRGRLSKSSGYAFNYLLPQGLATMATDHHKRMVDKHKAKLQANRKLTGRSAQAGRRARQAEHHDRSQRQRRRPSVRQRRRAGNRRRAQEERRPPARPTRSGSKVRSRNSACTRSNSATRAKSKASSRCGSCRPWRRIRRLRYLGETGRVGAREVRRLRDHHSGRLPFSGLLQQMDRPVATAEKTARRSTVTPSAKCSIVSRRVASRPSGPSSAACYCCPRRAMKSL